MMVVGTPLDDGNDVVGKTVVCGGVDKGITNLVMIILDGEGRQSATSIQ